ncbi:hypothetical protein KSU11_03245 [Fusobacterium nucleatum]|uniref:DUF6475 domain-containing protein n=3 Tax=Fusobacterium TaxID=848 RepID=UPI00206C4CD8|nr:MAG TPA: hypothetical protein [Caudoviricetes sp.]
MLKNTIVRYGSYGSVEFTDKGIHAVIDALDGWQNLCSMSSDELEKFLTFEFPKIYKAYTRNNYPVTQYYIGVHDAVNSEFNVNIIGYTNMGKGLNEAYINNKNNKRHIEQQQTEIKKLSEIIEKNTEN